jgi:hypothetical protein
MHQREVLAAGRGTPTDTLHIAWTAGNGVLTLLAMGFGAAALGVRFRAYSIMTMVILLAAGVLTSRDAPGVSAGLPTPWIGIWERINIGAWLLWIAGAGRSAPASSAGVAVEWLRWRGFRPSFFLKRDHRWRHWGES